MVIKIIFAILFANALFGLPEGSAYWNGSYFVKKEIRHQKHVRTIDGDTVYFYSHHFQFYGHGLLDAILPFYKILKENNLLNRKINIILETSSNFENNAKFNLFQLIKQLFQVKEIIWLHEKNKKKTFFVRNMIFHQGVPEEKPYNGNDLTFAFYSACPDSWNYIYDLKKIGFQRDVVYKGQQLKDNIVADFVNYIKEKYGINHSMIKNRVLFVKRGHPQKIKNDSEIISFLRSRGYDVSVVQFEKMDLKDQIIAASESEYFVGVYGSNLVNAIFLHPDAKVMVIWPDYAKYFWSRKYCIIHSAFLSLGLTLIEFDKPDDPRDVYTFDNLQPDYFYRQGKKVIMREEKKNLESILLYPLSASFELRTVDMFIEPYDFLAHMESHRNFSKNKI
ncbi:MAG: glycosyltransferase family 61 protein [Chlamydiae bacterium]|nr:glycosyltransferase family 61 protein [Chlamydiota bacterium]